MAFGFGLNRMGFGTSQAANQVVEWYLAANGVATPATTPTYSGPSAHWIADNAGLLKNMATLTNSSAQAIPPLRGSRIDGTVMRDTDAGGGALTTYMVFEPAATNYVSYSNTLSNGAWTKNNTSIGATPTTAPDGTDTAYPLLEAGVTGIHWLTRNVTVGAASRFCFYVKAFGRDYIGLRSSTGLITIPGNTAVINLTSGTVQTTGTEITNISVMPAANGFYRVSGTRAFDTNVQVVLMSDATTTSYAGDTSKGVYLWQLDVQGASVETSPIVTTTGTVTRSATDLSYPIASITGLAANGWMSRFKANVKELGREQWFYGCPTCGVGCYLNATNYFVYRSGTLGSDLVDTINTASAWTAAGTNTVADDTSQVKITYVDNASGASAAFSAAAGLSSDLTVGKTYRVSGVGRVNAGSSVQISTTPASVESAATITSTSNVAFSLTFRCTNATSNSLNVASMGTGEIAWVSGIIVKEVIEVTSSAAVAAVGEHRFGVSQQTTGATVSLDGTTTAGATATGSITWGTNLDVGSLNNANYLNGELAEDTEGRLITFRQGSSTFFSNNTF